MSFIKLETERLIIRDHFESDLESHFRLMSDNQTMYYIQDIKAKDIEDSKENLRIAIDEIDSIQRSKYFLKIVDKANEEHIGEIGYTVLGKTPVGKIAEMGYFIYAKHWNKGYVTEAVKRVLEHAFVENDIYRIKTGCIKENVGSERVMQKCGMTKEAEFVKIQWLDGKMRDRVEYRLLKEEYCKEE